MVDRAGSIKAILIALFLTLICRQISGFNVDGKSNIDWYWTPSASGKASVENKSSVAPGNPIVRNHIDFKILHKLDLERKRQMDEHRQVDIKKRTADIAVKYEIWEKSKAAAESKDGTKLSHSG
jgi:hypothetical protein